jgi:hypothetical protein
MKFLFFGEKKVAKFCTFLGKQQFILGEKYIAILRKADHYPLGSCS